VLGAHVEGPFINPQFRGAHDPGQILEPTQERVSNLLARPPRMVTLAPELPGALRAVERLRAAGVVVAAGHSGADFAQGMAAIAAGVRFGTHVFNAMTRFHHREPGLVAALLLDRRVALGLVLDGQHVHAAAAGLVLRIKPPRLCVLTTDQTSAAGAPPGRYRIGGREVRSDGRSVRLPDGTLAGSAAGMDELVREAAAAIGLTRAVRMASEAPARLLGERGLGRIEPGSAADLVVLDRNRRPRLTIVAGRVVYERR
jgi:N-acetylglucosamine-6-phosphate deacetylase